MRVKEHIRDVKKLNKKSALATHVIQQQQTIDFEKIKIIYQEKNYNSKNTVNLIQKFVAV